MVGGVCNVVGPLLELSLAATERDKRPGKGRKSQCVVQLAKPHATKRLTFPHVCRSCDPVPAQIALAHLGPPPPRLLPTVVSAVPLQEVQQGARDQFPHIDG